MLSIDMADRHRRTTPGPVGTIRFADLSSSSKQVEIWLPHNEATELVALRTDAPLEPAPRDRPTWLHHGSSISHGSNAESPSTTWPALAASRAASNWSTSGSAAARCSTRSSPGRSATSLPT